MLTFYSPGVVQLFLGLPLDGESRKSADHKQEAEKVRRRRSRIA